jgi:FG-GAP repeat
MDCLCTKEISAKFVGNGKLKASKLVGTIQQTATFKGEAKFNPILSKLRDVSATFNGNSRLIAKVNLSMAQDQKFIGEGKLRQSNKMAFELSPKFAANGKIRNTNDKFAGSIKNFDGYEKLYPLSDVFTDRFNATSEFGFPGGLDYSNFVDEGLFVGDYHLNGGQSTSLFEDHNYIVTSGTPAEIKVVLTDPNISFRDSFALFRASSDKSTQKIYDIKFKDSSGNLVCQYEDINFVGDGYFTTYGTKPLINNGAKYTWDSEYPELNLQSLGGDYTFEFKVESSCTNGNDPFNPAFGSGFNFCSYNNNLDMKISAVEICNSGDSGFRNELFFPIHVQVQSQGLRLEKCLTPHRVMPSNYLSTVWPNASSVWVDSNNLAVNNEDLEGQYALAGIVADGLDNSSMFLYETSIPDSGKLNIEFRNIDTYTFGYRNGEFGLSFNKNNYDVATFSKEKDDNPFFVIDEVTLKVRARKTNGGVRDFTLDVVGWSDDRLLNVTPKIGGFLQNTSGIGAVPTESGFYNLDTEGISTHAISDQAEYYEGPVITGSGSDHYVLYPNVVTSTTFQDYEIPLIIEPERIAVGSPNLFNNSSYFEKLFLDIYPIPEYAEIANISLCLKYKPSNALTFNTLGGPVARIKKDREEGKFFPIPKQPKDDYINTGSGYQDPSLIEDIPHAYKTPQTIKTNYARRWRGVEGLMAGPFDKREFDFSYEYKSLLSPFTLGHYDFNYVNGSTMLSRDIGTTAKIAYITNPNIVKNIGLRFKTKSTFADSRQTYESIHWTDPDYVASDSYDNVAVDFDKIEFQETTFDFDQGLAAFVRFSLRENFSPVSEFVVMEKQGEFTIAIDPVNNLIKGYVGDAVTSFRFERNRAFPLSVILTYNEGGNGGACLYVKYDDSNIIYKDLQQVNTFTVQTSNKLGLPQNDHVYVHEFAISNGNLLDEDKYELNINEKEHSVQKFLLAQSVVFSNPKSSTVTFNRTGIQYWANSANATVKNNTFKRGREGVRFETGKSNGWIQYHNHVRGNKIHDVILGGPSPSYSGIVSAESSWDWFSPTLESNYMFSFGYTFRDNEASGYYDGLSVGTAGYDPIPQNATGVYASQIGIVGSVYENNKLNLKERGDGSKKRGLVVGPHANYTLFRNNSIDGKLESSKSFVSMDSYGVRDALVLDTKSSKYLGVQPSSIVMTKPNVNTVPSVPTGWTKSPGGSGLPTFITSGVNPLAPQVGFITDTAYANESFNIRGKNLQQADFSMWAEGVLFPVQTLRMEDDRGQITIPPVTRDVTNTFKNVPKSVMLLFAANGYGYGNPVRINAPEIYWIFPGKKWVGQSDRTIRIFGNNLSIPGKRPTVLARNGSGDPVSLYILSYTEHEIKARLPFGYTAGDYSVYVHNGTGGIYGWSNTETFEVVVNTYSYSKKFYVNTFPGATDDDKISAAISAAIINGGGTVVFSARTYNISNDIVVWTATPPYLSSVILQGAGIGKTIIKVTGQEKNIELSGPGCKVLNMTLDGVRVMVRNVDAVMENLDMTSNFGILGNIGFYANQAPLGNATENSKYHALIKNCILRSVSANLWTSGRYIHVIGCKIYGRFGDNGVRYEDGSLASYSTLDNQGISIRGGHNFLVEHNTFESEDPVGGKILTRSIAILYSQGHNIVYKDNVSRWVGALSTNNVPGRDGNSGEQILFHGNIGGIETTVAATAYYRIAIPGLRLTDLNDGSIMGTPQSGPTLGPLAANVLHVYFLSGPCAGTMVPISTASEVGSNTILNFQKNLDLAPNVGDKVLIRPVFYQNLVLDNNIDAIPESGVIEDVDYLRLGVLFYSLAHKNIVSGNKFKGVMAGVCTQSSSTDDSQYGGIYSKYVQGSILIKNNEMTDLIGFGPLTPRGPYPGAVHTYTAGIQENGDFKSVPEDYPSNIGTVCRNNIIDGAEAGIQAGFFGFDVIGAVSPGRTDSAFTITSERGSWGMIAENNIMRNITGANGWSNLGLSYAPGVNWLLNRNNNVNGSYDNNSSFFLPEKSSGVLYIDGSVPSTLPPSPDMLYLPNGPSSWSIHPGGSGLPQMRNGEVKYEHPVISSQTDDTHGGETVSLLGQNLLNTNYLMWTEDEVPVLVKPIRSFPNKAQAVIPSHFEKGTILIWPVNERGYGLPARLNGPDLHWVFPGRKFTVDTDKTIRIFGTGFMSSGRRPLVVVKRGVTAPISLTIISFSDNEIKAELPANTSGTYRVWVHNGTGGIYGWSKEGTFEISTTDYAAIASTEFEVDAQAGATDQDKIQNALNLAAVSGGTIVFGPRQYNVTADFNFSGTGQNSPPTFLKGAGRDLTLINGVVSNNIDPNVAANAAIKFNINGMGSRVFDLSSKNICFIARSKDVTIEYCNIDADGDGGYSGCAGCYANYTTNGTDAKTNINFTIRYCNFTFYNGGVGTWGASHTYIYNNKFFGRYYNGFGNFDGTGSRIGDNTQNIAIGFSSTASHILVENNECYSLDPERGRVLNRMFLTGQLGSNFVVKNNIGIGLGSFPGGSNKDTNTGEAILFHGNGVSKIAKVAYSDWNSVVLNKPYADYHFASGDETPNIGWASHHANGTNVIDQGVVYLVVLTGPAAGQIKSIVSATGTSTTTFAIDRWQGTPPRPGDKIAVSSLFKNSLVLDNYIDHLNEDEVETLSTYVDEDTADWDLGAFKFKDFSASEYDVMTKRVGKDFINFRLVCDGQPYFSKTDITLPTVIDSGLSYHTQIENDFLRFHLSDTKPNFYAANIRISKDLPKDYHFAERAFVVETVADYQQSGDIAWLDGKLGPRLIVSLYTKNQEPTEYPTENYGLINRKIHYLDPKMSWERIDTTFDPESFFDETEAWSVFPEETRLTEFEHKYFSKDVDDMFLQYDVVTPSGQPFEINFNIHSAHVRLEDALVKTTELFNSLNVSVRSADYISYGSLPLITDAIYYLEDSMLLHSKGRNPPKSSGNVLLHTSGACVSTLPLSTHGHSGINTSMAMYTSGNYRVEGVMNIYVQNSDTALPSNLFLPLYTECEVEDTVHDNVNIICYSSLIPGGKLDNEASFPMYTIGTELSSIYRDGAVNLHTVGPNYFHENLNLVVYGEEFNQIKIDDEVNMHTICYPLVYLGGSGVSVIAWTSTNVGRDTEENDDFLFQVPSNDPIRGIRTICWGDCSVDSGKCVEKEVNTHNTLWYEESCVDGGILRPSELYRENGYNGHFYGTRKYQGLLPNLPYEIKVKVQTGSNQSYPLPRIFEDWEYGTLGDIDYSGVKIVEPSRNVVNQYSKAVKCRNDLMAVSAPGKVVEGYDNAGTIYLYRRDELLSSGDKAGWSLEKELNLPSGFIEDWWYDRGGHISFPGIGTIPERQWNVGQEGRELGHSLDISISGGREVLVAGGPGCKWTRQFVDIETSGVNVALMIFSDEFNYSNEDYDKIIQKLEINNFLYKYFAEPAVHIDLKIINYYPTGIFDTDFGVDTDQLPPGYVYVKKIPRQPAHLPVDSTIAAEMLSGIKEGFFEAYPYDNAKPHNNIPPIIAYYIDESRSLGKEVVQPAVDQFFDFYKSYAFNSGVQDFYGVPSSGEVYEKVMADGIGENWFDFSQDLVDEVLDTGRLVANGSINLITSGIGLQFANLAALEFNIHPDSGGRVYIFEKEGNDWSLTQQIKSPNLVNTKEPNRFGHSVAISDDGRTIAVGSPFIRESCSIYRFDESERQRLYGNIGEWLELRNTAGSGSYDPLVTRYEELKDASGTFAAGEQLYLEMNVTDRYKARSDFDYWGTSPIEEFKLSYRYGLDDVEAGITGLFTKVPRGGAGNPRLGYSSAINDDGTVVAFGSPTDSLGIHENADFYFKHDIYFDPENPSQVLPEDGTWASNVNAGAVRIFEKTNTVVPTTDIVVEYNKFGNLSNTLNGTEGYDEFGNEINTTIISKHPNYVKTNFAEVKIPDEAGAIFIITPEIDAANEEVIDEIKRWLSLGDRRLVLVGEDPVWEKDGLYSESNRIINKILEGLDSRMRLHPARNKYEALLVNNENTEFRTNVIESFTPAGSNPTSVENTLQLHAFGAADIRLHIPDITMTADNWGKDDVVVANKKYGICTWYNPLCGPPIAHNGDLRAHFVERELTHPPSQGVGDPYTYWERNLPFEFNSQGIPSVKPEEALKIARDINVNAKGEQPRPLMVAAEFEPVSGIIPAIPEVKKLEPIYEYTTYEVGEIVTYYEFEENHIEETAFVWSEDSGNYNFVNRNIANNVAPGIFYNPGAFLNRDPLLQAQGVLSVDIDINEIKENIQVDDHINLAARQEYGDSEVYLIANVYSESKPAMATSKDHNISFYDNLVLTNCGASRIVQLGGWTGRNSFTDGYADSILKGVFTSMGHDVEEGWSGTDLPGSRDVAWIANTRSVPSDADAGYIKSWLNKGGKKLVITYDTTKEGAFTALLVCEKLGLTIKPWYLPSVNDMPVAGLKFTSKNSVDILLNLSEESVDGCTIEDVETFTHDSSYIPIRIDSGHRILYHDGIVFDQTTKVVTEYEDLWKMNTGVAQVQFPAIPGSGYRIFYNWYSDFPGEDKELDIYFGDVHWKATQDTKAMKPSECQNGGEIPIMDFDSAGDSVIAEKATFYKTFKAVSYGVATDEAYVDIQVPSGNNYVNVFITGNRSSINVNSNQTPRTCKFLSVSGCPLPIKEKTEVITETFTESKIVGYNEVITQQYVPASSIFLPATIRPIMTDNTKYCQSVNDCGGKLVADGPVLIAEEPEHFSAFTTGRSRSKIVLISDSTIVNGRFADNSEIDPLRQVSGVPTIPSGILVSNIHSLLSSLTKVEPDTDRNFDGNSYRLSQKIVSPEKGSPALYSLASGSSIPNVWFGGDITTVSVSGFVDESDYDNSKVVRHFYTEPKFEDAEIRVWGEFQGSMGTIGSTSKISRIINATLYEDPPLSGNPYSEFMKDTGKDFLDPDILGNSASGYLGDLFGYSIDLHNGKLVVGTPFAAWPGDVVKLSGIVDETDLANRIDVGINGGGGSTYVFEKDLEQGWVSNYKLRPSSVTGGYSDSDRFGWAVSIDADFIAVGAPGHDFGVEPVVDSGEFVRKEFDGEFDIGGRIVQDLDQLTGTPVSGIGAVYTFENRLYDWPTRSKALQFTEKITANGYKSDEPNSNFGNAVCISRFARADSDYLILTGSKNSHTLVGPSFIKNAGAAYTNDGMLRQQPPSRVDSSSRMQASVFGRDKDNNRVDFYIDQLQNYDEDVLYYSGIVYSDEKGQIFLESSGQDPREFSFIEQRPRIVRIDGNVLRGTPAEEFFVLHTDGLPYSSTESINLHTSGPDYYAVYNNMNLHTQSAYFENTSDLMFVTDAIQPTEVDSSMLFHTSGIGFLSPYLSLRVRGK